MKQFFGAFFGSIIGMIVAMLLGVLLIVGIVKSGINSALKNDKDDATEIAAGSVLRLELDGVLTDREKNNPFRELGDVTSFVDNESMGLNTLTARIRQAKDDDNVKGIYLRFKRMRGGFAGFRELRDAIIDFKRSGKFVYSYGEDLSQQQYYLASASSKVFLNPEGSLEWRGLSMSLVFFKRTFEKLDLQVQVFRHGKFKSAVEPFLLDKMSEANRIQSEAFLGGIWSAMLADISASRNISVPELNGMADQLSIRTAVDAVGKLVDVAAYEDQVHAELKRKIGMKETEKLKFTDMNDYTIKPKGDVKTLSNKVAVIYAIGAIGGGEGGDEEIGSDRIARTIREARLDDRIKAIVLRVNSPGGSALASDVIWREVTLAKKSKPTVVSMGDLAASGGYYISCGADRIFAEPNTITGSIGVFGLVPNFGKMFENKFGITVDTVNTNRHSDIGTGLRMVTEDEYQYIQQSVEKVYDTFTKRVAEGRHMSQADVDSIGQGRVWSGSDALKLGLVDELGGLDKAVAYAVKKAKLSDYRVTELPRQKGPLDGFFGTKEKDLENTIMRHNLGQAYTYLKYLRTLIDMKGVQARLPYEMIINE